MQCPQCRVDNPTGAKFCRGCGPNGFPPGKNVRMALIAALGFAQLPSQAPELQPPPLARHLERARRHRGRDGPSRLSTFA